MDRTSIGILILCFILFVMWAVLAPRYSGPQQRQPAQTAESVETPSVVHPATLTQANTVGAVASASATTRPDVPEQLVVVSNRLVRFHISSHGGGISCVELLQYPERPVAHGAEATRPVTLNAEGELPMLALKVGSLQSWHALHAVQCIGNVAVAEAVLTNGLKVVKRYELGDGYLMKVAVTVENTTTQAIDLAHVEYCAGTAAPLPDDSARDVRVVWYNGHKTVTIDESWFANRVLGCFPGTPRSEYNQACTNLVWVGANNRFFVLATMPQQAPSALWCVPVSLSRTAAETNRVHKPGATGYRTGLAFRVGVLEPGARLHHEFVIYAGPKEYRRLSKLGSEFGNDLQRVMGFENVLGGRFTAFFAKLLLVSMNALHDLLKLGYGWIIIVFTFIIKLLFWPLTQASTRSMKRLQELQPQMNEIREKYKDNPEKLNRKMLEFMKEHRVNPFSGCLPILVQMPVFIGFFVMIQSAIELRGAAFLWVRDLSQPDTLFRIPGLGIPFNLLPLIMGATMIWQSHLTPVSPGMDPTQQRLMRWMPLIFLVLLYNFPSGLTLYWTVQNLLTIAQMKLTRASKDSQPVQQARVKQTQRRER